MWVKIAELNTESKPRLVTGLSFHQRCESSHYMARLHLPLRDPWPFSCLFMREHFLTFLWCVRATTCLRMLSTIYSLRFDTSVVEYLTKTHFFQMWFWPLWHVYACGVFECWRLMLCVLSAWECDCSAQVFSSSIRGSCRSWNSDFVTTSLFL